MRKLPIAAVLSVLAVFPIAALAADAPPRAAQPVAADSAQLLQNVKTLEEQAKAIARAGAGAERDRLLAEHMRTLRDSMALSARLRSTAGAAAMSPGQMGGMASGQMGGMGPGMKGDMCGMGDMGAGNKGGAMGPGMMAGCPMMGQMGGRGMGGQAMGPGMGRGMQGHMMQGAQDDSHAEMENRMRQLEQRVDAIELAQGGKAK